MLKLQKKHTIGKDVDASLISTNELNLEEVLDLTKDQTKKD